MWLQQEQLGQVGREGEGWKAGALSVQRRRTGSLSAVRHQLEMKMQNPDKELPSSPPQLDFLRVKQQDCRRVICKQDAVHTPCNPTHTPNPTTHLHHGGG